MYTLTAKLSFRIPESSSLKDKRQVRRSLIDKTRGKFNASVAEVGKTESHKELEIGVAVVSGSLPHAEGALDEIIRFMENTAKAEMIDVDVAQC